MRRFIVGSAPSFSPIRIPPDSAVDKVDLRPHFTKLVLTDLMTGMTMLSVTDLNHEKIAEMFKFVYVKFRQFAQLTIREWRVIDFGLIGRIGTLVQGQKMTHRAAGQCRPVTAFCRKC